VLGHPPGQKVDVVHPDLSSVTLVPLLSAALLILAGTALVQRSRGSNSRSRSRTGSSSRSGSRHTAGPRIGARLAAAPDPRFAAGGRFAPNQGGVFASAPFASASRFAPDQGASFAAVPRFATAPGASFSTAQATGFAAGPRVAPELRLASDLSLVPELRLARDLTVTPELRVEPDLRLARDLTVTPDLRVEPGLRVEHGPGDHLAAQPDPRLGSQPDPQVGSPATPWSFSVLAALTEGDKARPDFAPSNSGVAFPTRGRALSLLGGHMLAALGILILALASTPIGHHLSQLAHTSAGSLALLCVFVGFVFAVVAAARIQHDIMGGGWYPGFSPRYISPEVALYAIRPSGLSAAARRLNLSSAPVILVVYGCPLAGFLIVLGRYVAR
jgi:hypothetical protein